MRMVTIFLSGALSVGAYADDLEKMTAEGAILIPPFQQHLMDTVKSAMQTGGPVKAVEACQLLAPQIADQHSQTPWCCGSHSIKGSKSG